MKPISPAAELIYRLLGRGLTLDVTWLMVLDRDSLQAAKSKGDGVQIVSRLLTPRDIEQLASLREYELPLDYAKRLTSGVDFCVGVFANADLTSYAWFALKSIKPENNRGRRRASGVGFSYPPHMAFMYKGFTAPAYRGQGMYKQVPRAAFELLADHGVTTILSTADWSNAAALASCTRLGFQPLGRVWVAGLGPLVWRKRPARAVPLGIHEDIQPRSRPPVCSVVNPLTSHL